MREHFRARWAAYVAGLVAAGLAVIVALYVFRKKPEPEARIAPDSPLELAQKERARALEACDEARSRADTPKGLSRAAWKECIDGLDRAALADPAGDADPRVVRARDDARKAQNPFPLPTPSAVPLPIPTASATTPPRSIPTVTAPTTIPRPRNTSSMTPASSGGFGSGP